MSILLEVRCRLHPSYRAVQYPRRGRDGRCEYCMELWRLKRDLSHGIQTMTSGDNP